MSIVEWLRNLTATPVLPSDPYLGRITGKQFLEIDEGHQTTYVTGLMDMLGYADHYVSREYSAHFIAIAGYAGKFKSGDLRNNFVQYMKADPVRETYLVAGSFVAFLREGAQSSG